MASRWPHLAGPAFVVHDFASGDSSPVARARPTIWLRPLLSSISPLARSRHQTNRGRSL